MWGDESGQMQHLKVVWSPGGNENASRTHISKIYAVGPKRWPPFKMGRQSVKIPEKRKGGRKRRFECTTMKDVEQEKISATVTPSRDFQALE